MGERLLHTIQFKITRTDKVPPLLDQVIKAITPLLPIAPGRQEEMSFKTRIIISELLTNTIKHTQQQSTVLEVEIYENGLQFVRRDHSLPLHFPAIESREALLWPLHEKYFNKKMVVYEDDLNALWVTISETGAARFSVTPKPAESCNINSLHEHFGLLLVTLSSDSFTYDFNANTGENVFITFISF